MDFNVICRICLKANKESTDIFSSFYMKRQTLYADMLASCTKLQPKPEDSLPRQICKECTKHLKRTYSFNLLCEESDKKLQSYLHTAIADDLINLVKNESELKLKCSKLSEETESSIDQTHYRTLDVAVQEIKEVIKNEPTEDETFWDADDNVVLGEMKSNSEVADNDLLVKEPEKLKKKRGRKKKDFDSEAPKGSSKLPHQCDECGKVLSNKSNLKAHKVCHTDRRPYSCGDCPATFRGYSALFLHRRLHTGEKPFHCEYCPKQFRRRAGLVNHIRMHTGEKKFSCDICFKAFVQSAQLSIHMKRHKGEKPYLCQDCGKGFPIKADLRVHQRTHNGEKPYSCHLCTKTFATSGNLSIHVRIHKKEIRYNCKECQRGFVTPSAFALHVKRHKGQRDYSCDCGKTFYTSSALKQHKVVHTGEKNYQCKICERKFTQAGHLSRHFKRDHAKNGTTEPYKVAVSKSVLMMENGIGMNAVKCETVA